MADHNANEEAKNRASSGAIRIRAVVAIAVTKIGAVAAAVKPRM